MDGYGGCAWVTIRWVLVVFGVAGSCVAYVNLLTGLSFDTTLLSVCFFFNGGRIQVCERDLDWLGEPSGPGP